MGKRVYASRPDYVVHPGAMLRARMQERGISQKALAKKMRRPQEQVSRLVNGHIDMTPQWALGLEKALRLPPAEYWMNLDSAYQLGKARGLKVITQATAGKGGGM